MRRTPVLLAGVAAGVTSLALLPAASASPTAVHAAHTAPVPVSARVAATSVALPSRAVRAAKLAALREHAVRQVRSGRPGPYGPDPELALVPDNAELDWGGWDLARARRSQVAATRRAQARVAQARRATPATATALATRAPLLVREDEPAGTRGGNDTLAAAQLIGAFGTATRPVADIRGRLSPEIVAASALTTIVPNKEDDGFFGTPRETGVAKRHRGIATTGRLGDNPEQDGEQEADEDLYALDLRAGDDVAASFRRTSGDPEPLLALLDADFDVVADTFDSDIGAQDVDLSANVRAAGRYYLVVTGYTVVDLDTGTETLPSGGYRLTLAAVAGDRDVYAVKLHAGDVVGVSAEDAATYVSFYDTAGTEVHGSPEDASSAYPLDSPLPGGGNAVSDTVVPADGTYYLAITGSSGTYSADLEVYRFGGAGRRQTQVVYLDTDGQRVNTGVYGGRGVTTLSPLRSFLAAWGLPRSAERPLVEKIKATVQENIEKDLRGAGVSSYVDVKVVTPFDGPDPWGRPGVTRLIVGGTIQESGVATIGIAQSIDPGNYEREETALVLLDSLSEPGDADLAPYSLNTYLRPSSDRVGFIGRAVGNVVSHEAGHMFGSWHTDETNSRADLMDAGGNFRLLFGVGRDGIGGTRDDTDVDFGTDRFNLFEGFSGLENTKARTTAAVSSRAEG